VWKRKGVAVLVCALIAIPAFADDVIIPPWRGLDGTTYQQWSFDDNDNPALPEIINNPYGGAVADITLGVATTGWLNEFPGVFGSKQGMWDLGYDDPCTPEIDPGSIVLLIDDRDEPLPYKEIWIQVTYWRDIHQAPTINVEDAAYITGETVHIESGPVGGDWMLDQSIWQITPNPVEELVIVLSDPMNASIVDQIVVDTYCVPEPVSAVLLAFGGLALACRRRR
jgi:hypothetical protein